MCHDVAVRLWIRHAQSAPPPRPHIGIIGDSKIDVPLFATIGTLAVVWLVSVVGLALTIKRCHLPTFASLQTGCDFLRGHFLDNEGHDARRVDIFFNNARKWQAIRNLVRQWVLSVYDAWKALMPAWLTEDLQARIPDDFVPAEVVHELNVQAPGGRWPTAQSMGMLRPVSHVDVAWGTDSGVPRLYRTTESAICHGQPAILHDQQCPDRPRANSDAAREEDSDRDMELKLQLSSQTLSLRIATDEGICWNSLSRKEACP